MRWQDQAQALWKDRWKSTLALTAGRDKRTIQRWNSGENRPHPEVLEKLNKTYEVWKNDE
jgi:ribosome-binding protein aMBF1 (putative translation factor)